MIKKILITDDHTIVRKGVVSLLKERFPFLEAEEAETAADAIALLKKNYYDLLILDLNLPDANAEKLINLVKVEAKETPIIVFSMFPASVMEKSMLKLGAAKYVSKGDDIKKLQRAVEEVVLGKIFSMDESKMSTEQESPFSILSPKELSVMIAFFDGKSNKEVADALSLSASTVATYKQRLLEKTKTHSITELLKIALQFNVYNFPKER